MILMLQGHEISVRLLLIQMNTIVTWEKQMKKNDFIFYY